MFKQSLIRRTPLLKNPKTVIVALWLAGVLFVSIGFHVAQAREAQTGAPPTPGFVYSPSIR
jgi:hypothetical protein